jgi:hypothetical protein
VKVDFRCKAGLFLSLFLVVSGGYSYTFTSIDGAQFDGELLFVDRSSVTVLRSSDNQRFNLPKSRFAKSDQSYFEEWAKKNPKANLPGHNVKSISLRCSTKKTNDESIVRETGRTLVDVNVSQSVYWNYDWVTVDTRVDVTARPETEKVRLKGVTVHVQASSVSGPVIARIYTAFFRKSGGERFIFKVDRRDVKVSLVKGELYASCSPVEDYYGYGTVAFNLATGKMIGIAASNHTIEKILKSKARSGKIN